VPQQRAQRPAASTAQVAAVMHPERWRPQPHKRAAAAHSPPLTPAGQTCRAERRLQSLMATLSSPTCPHGSSTTLALPARRACAELGPARGTGRWRGRNGHRLSQRQAEAQAVLARCTGLLQLGAEQGHGWDLGRQGSSLRDASLVALKSAARCMIVWCACTIEQRLHMNVMSRDFRWR
jgi:hypothetical protein